MGKILYVDSSIDGHHLAYLSALIKDSEYKYVLALPEKIIGQTAMQYVYKPIDLSNKKIIPFLRWIREIIDVAKRENVDIVHFLNGDDFYKYFGLGLGYFKHFKTIMTLHWIRPGSVKHLSLKIFSNKIDTLVVHSKYLCNEAKNLGIRNVVKIEYPQFKKKIDIKHEIALEYWDLDKNIPVIGCIGGTREDKGLDLLLDALNKIQIPFQLLIAGKPETFDETYIDNHYRNNSKLVKALRFLTDDEVDLAIEASDIIALPYRFSFNGASGPLCEGVSRLKCIIGPSHGNLGYEINTHHLGYTFETENVESLIFEISKALEGKFSIDTNYKQYQASLDANDFVKKYGCEYARLMENK